MGVNTIVLVLAGGLVTGIILFIIWYSRKGKKDVEKENYEAFKEHK